ncbi:NAD(P)H-binding protein [Sphingomonas sp. So64.6b]|uniref:NAD(P)H-binding protein n=1 Tax=Sphingomonas sp. So64.6b TaxID=2997354 RepID=UPI001603D1CE|nr:NAD(P)H-binding protein [Sphingomonas sp. So64.6b]QNA86480.1 NAD(P)H-binding protein [Sphingomonas sp. So64.6b]
MTSENTLRPGTTLVLGANGKTGSRVAARLWDSGHDVRIGSRSATPGFDWDDRATWGAALAGVSAVYAAYQPDLCVPGAVETISDFFDAAAGAGVARIVLLSGRGEPECLDAERALQATTLDWTIIRASWFFQNFSEGFFLDEILAGEIALPDSLADEPFVDAEDIADIAVAALISDRHNHQLYEVTGPQAISFADAIAQIASATGREIAYREMSMEAYRQALEAAQLPADIIGLVIYLFSTVLDGRNLQPTNDIQRALGRAPGNFADYVARTAATGVWEAK